MLPSFRESALVHCLHVLSNSPELAWSQGYNIAICGDACQAHTAASAREARFDNPSYEHPERPFLTKEKREAAPKRRSADGKPKVRAKPKVKQEKTSPKGKPAKGSGKRKRS